jgi:hypothetical protein
MIVNHGIVDQGFATPVPGDDGSEEMLVARARAQPRAGSQSAGV